MPRTRSSSRSRSPVSRGWRPGDKSYRSSSREDVKSKYKNDESRRDRERDSNKYRKSNDNLRLDTRRDKHPNRDRYRQEDIDITRRKNDRSGDRLGNRDTDHYSSKTKHRDAAFDRSTSKDGREMRKTERANQYDRPRSNSKTKTDLPARYKGVYNEKSSPNTEKNEDNLPQQYRHYNRIENSDDTMTNSNHIKYTKEKSTLRENERTIDCKRKSRSKSRSESKSNRQRSASSSTRSKSRTKTNNKQTKELKAVKRKRSTSSEEPLKKVKSKRQKTKSKDSGSESGSSDSSPDRRKKKRKKNKKEKKRKNKNSKKKKSKKKKSKQLMKQSDKAATPGAAESNPLQVSANTERKAMAPMTKEEWEKQQSVVKRVFDPATGRTRLVKGDGEIIEEIVSKERHKEICKLATLGDGLSYRAAFGLHKY
ncbi:uncharacterized protein LOC100366753 [Saccoglossus kowalevskii]|uniref:ADP-ribosylation factor-like protein 6-interacting protein 4 n=1 Tax=Saccoglossus kowalevskii TaxID=10224 RepID=A0ABM0M718_SACKO|nr:PREDICTED: ADP-ribosylation factor-like protein 6-interacting protein 4-like [Saccoglossus kowalevskii]